ncbi:MAG: PA14 domain-containing protein [Planctomycetota bacterium]|nr:PA14 domain-containing protein [Planctomycetota bacterium]
MSRRIPLFGLGIVQLCCLLWITPTQSQTLQLPEQARIAIIGNTLADRMQHHGWLETYTQALHPKHTLIFRNLGFAGDEVSQRPRSNNFGSTDQWLTKTQADVVFCFFGYNEALKGADTVNAFRTNLATMIDQMKAQKYNGTSAPVIVIFSPIAHENLNSPHLPDGSANNAALQIFTAAMQQVCESKSVRFVDIFHPTLQAYQSQKHPLTLNGVHLLDRGNETLARIITQSLFGRSGHQATTSEHLQKIHSAVLDRNYYWFSRYRVVDGYNVYGGRSKLAWFGQSNADVMKREMEIFDVMTANRDQRITAITQGRDIEVVDDNLPEELVVKTNKPGTLEGGAHIYLDAEAGIEKMQVAEGMKVNVFASEEMFPELINPVQMAVDPNGVLFASVWPSYPHWNPTQPRTDRLLCFPDENRDGVADECIIFADKLNSVTGFEFWGGGVLVAAPPEIWFLKDTDGDNVADQKLRMLQGVSSADTHHSANAFVIGPDGGLYWSRGIFNVANMETPTKTFRSGQSGVYRFDPRTFEMSFVFPIGPNPHGDVFDQWGYQFANDGTSGTGSYVNIGKGQGNKQWFKKRVRPVAATGILSSSHFPERNNGNFLVCNCIGFLGVLQHQVHYDGADITAEEIEPILVSSDPNFRPTDIEVGGDGALYVSDWANALIGHMQHNMRDPNRDANHGRIYRVSVPGRPLVPPVKMIGKPVETVLQSFLLPENGVRYRARLELSGRKSVDVTKAVTQWAGNLDITDPVEAQALLECLWVFEEHRIANLALLEDVFQAEEPRIRAAAIRTLGHWSGKVTDWEEILQAAAEDASPLVRAEALKAAVELQGLAAAEVVFQVATKPLDAELQKVLTYATGSLNVDAIVKDAVANGSPLSNAAQLYVLRNASIDDLLKMEATEAVYTAILTREKASVTHLQTAITGLASIQKTNPLNLIVDLLTQRDSEQTAGTQGLARLLAQQPATELQKRIPAIERLALQGKSDDVRRYAFAAWITTDGNGDNAFLAATRNRTQLQDFLASVPLVTNPEVQGQLYSKLRPLMWELPGQLGVETAAAGPEIPGIHVDYYQPSAGNVDINTLNKLTPKESGIAKQISINVPQRKAADLFALKFTGFIQVDRPGRYTFFAASDDGSRIYLNDKLLVNNDGLHGIVEKSAAIELPAGSHKIVVTYFDNGGGDGLSIQWSGPGIKKQLIAADRLSVSGGETIHDHAIRAISVVPGHDMQKFGDLTQLFKTGQHRHSAIQALLNIAPKHWNKAQLPALADNLVAYLSEIPAQYRTSGSALKAIELANAIGKQLPDDQTAALNDRLKNLDVRVIAIGTVAHRMIYDKEQIAVQAGKPVEFRFSNTDNMPHNFVITKPGTMEEIGLLAEATGRDADAMQRHYVPNSEHVLLRSNLLQNGELQALLFNAPETPGVYPYVCTYPGHWRRMYGTLYVVADLQQYEANPDKYLANNPLPIKDDLLKISSRGREWKLEELVADINPLPPGRSYEVGKELFKVASCVACHKLGEEGQVFGPDLAKLDVKKHTTLHILQSMLDPSKEIDKKFLSHTFLLDSGKVITGMIVEESPDAFHVVIDPLAKGKPTVIPRSSIEAQKESTVSLMPKGMLNKLSREEILDLIAYVLARGDKTDKQYEHEHNH